MFAKASQQKWLKKVASPRGLEPPTYGLGNRGSIRLSYGRARMRHGSSRGA